MKKPRSKSTRRGPLTVGELRLDTQTRQLTKNGQTMRLAPKLCELLELFMRYPGQVLDRAFIMDKVWKTKYLGDLRTLEVHVSLLRKIIEDNPRKPTYVRTVRTVGYRFDAED